MPQNVPEDDRPMLRRPEFGRIRSALAASSHFQSLDGSDLDRLAQLGRLHHLRHGERAARNGAYEDRFYLILSGAVRVSSQMPGAKEFVFAVLGPGSYFGLATAGTAAFTADARAFGPTDLAVFPDPPRSSCSTSARGCGSTSGSFRAACASRLVLRDNSVAPLERIARACSAMP